ncbi:MAG: hypothetical protein IJH50_11320 [Kiritimatiellae bacterium]|nr:hypothetical protein [Kiritimatiellia bacterium]
MKKNIVVLLLVAALGASASASTFTVSKPKCRRAPRKPKCRLTCGRFDRGKAECFPFPFLAEQADPRQC